MEFLTNYLNWHYTRAPLRIIQITGNYLAFFFHFFSVNILVRTLFSPWKRELIKREKPGIQLEEILNILSFNLISRTIGAIIRLVTILGWLLCEGFTLILGILIFLAWLMLPGFTILLFFFLKPEADPTRKILKKGENDPQKIFLLVLKTKMAKFVLSRLGINSLSLKKIDSPQPAVISFPSAITSLETLIPFLAKTWPPFKNYLFQQELEEKDIASCCLWFKRQEEQVRQQRRFWELDNLLAKPTIGKDWTYGYTQTLDQYSFDLGRPQAFSHHLVGRQKTIEQMERVLCRSQGNNLLLVGEAGVGKQTTILSLAKRIKEGKIHPFLAYKKVLSLNLNQILATARSEVKAKGNLAEIFKEASLAGNIILVINQFGNYLTSQPGQIDLSEVLTKTLAEDKLQIIGVSTPDEFQKKILPRAEVMKYFEKVEVVAPSQEEALIILENIVPEFEKTNQVFVFYQSLIEVLEKSDQYLIDAPFPEKAIDLLDETCVYTANKTPPRVVTPKDVDIVLAEKTKIPLGSIEKEEAEKLKNLEVFLHRRIVNQEEAINAISRTMRRARLEISEKGKPLGTFLFLGPTGVGKTETAKALAACYFGSEDQMIRLDMSEYQGEIGFNKALGSPTSNEPGIFVKKIRSSPFSVLLLDEIEKTDPKILNLFLVILDEGYFTDNFGKKIDCRHLIIIGTSNAGSEFIRQQISHGASGEQLNKDVLEFIQKEEIFSPEFLNRFDGVVVYRPLTPEQLRQVAKLLLNNLNQRLAQKEISLKITDQLIERVATLGYQPTLGARPMRRVIQDKIEDQIAQKILHGEIKRGEKIELEI